MSIARKYCIRNIAIVISNSQKSLRMAFYMGPSTCGLTISSLPPGPLRPVNPLQGVPVVTRVPEDKAQVFTPALIACAVSVNLVAALIAASVLF